MFLTVFTPTYNRAYILEKCFESLKNQTCLDFEWIVVDDGSTDNTAELVKAFVSSAPFPVHYIYQENSGKHIAHNTAAKFAGGELFLCLDSDDLLTPDAVEVSKEFWQCFGKTEYTGILAKRGAIDTGKPICGTWDDSLKSSKMYDLTHKHNFSGDTALLFRTEVLKKVSFKCFKNEKFLTENNLYYDIDKFGNMLLMDRVIYLCEYLPDGLTANYFKLLRENPNGTADTYYKELCLASGFTAKVKSAVLTDMYFSLSSGKNELDFKKHRVLLSLLFVPAVLFRKRFLCRIEKSGEKI